MPVPALITDLSTTPSNNYPTGGDAPGVLDNHQRAHAAFIASIAANSGNGWVSPYLPLTAGGTVAGNVTVTPGILWVGDSATNNSVDPQIVISRDVDASGSGNGHAYTDSSTINRSGGVSYNSYDARITVSGTYSYDHYAAFQVGPTFAGSGTVSNLYSFVSSPAISSGTLTNYYGVIINPVTVSGTGSVTNAYGVYLSGTFGSEVTGLKFAFYNASTARAYSAGQIVSAVGLVAGNGAGSAYTSVQGVDVVTNDGTAAGSRLQQVGQNYWDFTIPASQTYLKLSDVVGEKVRVLSAGNIGINCAPNASALLDVQSTTMGLRLPNMTTTQKNAISSPSAGLMVFDTSLSKACLYTGAAWQTITSV